MTASVLANPHFPWHGIDRFWDLHLTIPGQVNVEGSSLMGFPAVNIGHNRHVAWSHTVSTAQRFTLFELSLDPSDPTHYMYDGKSVPMTSRTVSVPVKGGDKASQTFWYSQFGPVLARPSAGLSWTNSTVYALSDANDQLRAADTWMHMDRAKSAKDLVAAQSKFQGDPWVNTIGADDTGTAFYADDSVVPNVDGDKIDSCIKPGLSAAIHAATGLIPLDGSTSACGWGNDSDAAVKGIFGPSNLPITFRKDYVLNANDSYWQTNAKAPLTGFSPIIGCEDCRAGPADAPRPRDGRPADGRERRPRQEAGLHAPQPPEHVAGRSEPRRGADLLQPGPAVRRKPGDLDAVGERQRERRLPDPAQLQQDGEARLARRLAVQRVVGALGLRHVLERAVRRGAPLTTPNTLNQSDPASIEALGEAVQDLRDQGIPLDASYGDVQYTPSRKGGKIPIHGCSTGCWQAIYADASTGLVSAGSSTVQMTEFRPNGPKAHWLLTYSQSESTDSKHFNDQTKQFSKSKFIPMLFTGKQIKSDPHYKLKKVTNRKGKGGKGGKYARVASAAGALARARCRVPSVDPGCCAGGR